MNSQGHSSVGESWSLILAGASGESKSMILESRSANPVIHGREDVNLAPLRRGISASPWPTRGAPGSLWPVHEFARDRPVGLPF